MKNIIFVIIATMSFSVMSLLQAETRRFYAGNILRAEIMPYDEAGITVKNMSKYEPDLNIANPACALITFNVDNNRSISIYDYYLVYGADEFPCIALMTPTGEFDRDQWEIRKTRSDKKYTMLFKVPMPPRGKSGIYSLRFRLKPNGQVPDVQLQLMNAEETGFTTLRLIPINGMVSEKPLASGKKKKKSKKKKRKRKSVAKRTPQGEVIENEDEAVSQRKPNKGELEPPKQINEKVRKKNDLDAWNSFGN
jgi:hypothetical protein